MRLPRTGLTGLTGLTHNSVSQSDKTSGVSQSVTPLSKTPAGLTVERAALEAEVNYKKLEISVFRARIDDIKILLVAEGALFDRIVSKQY